MVVCHFSAAAAASGCLYHDLQAAKYQSPQNIQIDVEYFDSVGLVLRESMPRSERGQCLGQQCGVFV